MRLKDSNCFGLFLDKDHKKEPELAGREVYLLASLMNHSCRPNCEIDVNRTTSYYHVIELFDEKKEYVIDLHTRKCEVRDTTVCKRASIAACRAHMSSARPC